MTRDELKRMATDRVTDAKALLASKRWTAAYYLIGYAVECALKACIIERLMRTDQFPEKSFSQQCYTHALPQLLKLAGLEEELDIATSTDVDLNNSWKTVKDWSETSRYFRSTKAKAEELFEAVTHRKYGVLTWTKARW